MKFEKKYIPLAVWLLMSLGVGFIAFLIFRGIPHLLDTRYEPVGNLEGVASMFGVLVTIITAGFALVGYFTDKATDHKYKRDEIYQTLELASEDLFTLEIEHRDLIHKFFKDDADFESLDDAEQFAAEEYFCKVLNLQEMAVNFRLEGISHPSIFATWVAWMEETCVCPVFQTIWRETLCHHYDIDFAAMLNRGIELFTGQEGYTRESRRKFYCFVAYKLGEVKTETPSPKECAKSPVISLFDSLG